MVTTTPPRRVSEVLDRPGNGGGSSALTPRLRREIFRKVIAMGLPSMASFLLMTIYDLVDVFWLAKIGETPVAAVTMFAAFLWVVSFPNMIVGSGSVAVISRRFGEQDAAGTERAIKNTFFAKFALGCGLGVAGTLALPAALAFLGAAPDVASLGVAYGRIQFAILGISLVSFSVYTALRGIGRPALGVWISLAGTIVNLVLDPLLIFGIGPFPRLGIVGASLASAAGFTVVSACGLVALASSGSPVRVRWMGSPRPEAAGMLGMMRVGLPSGFSGLSFSLTASIVVKLVATYGTTVVALFGMSEKVLQFGIMVIVGLGLGTGALVGQYLGARELHRAWLSAILTMQVGAVTMLLFGLGVALFAPQLVRFFFEDPDLLAPGTLYLRLLAIGLPFVGLSIGTENVYSGAGLNMPPLLMHLVTGWALTIPLMLLLGRVMGLGPAGMMAGNSLGNALGAIIAVWLVRRGTWLEHRV